MTPSTALRSATMRFAASRSRAEVIHLGAELRRVARRAPHRLEYFHQCDDPHSHLAVQVLESLRATYEVEISVHVVGPPGSTSAPDPSRGQAWALMDAAAVAPDYGLIFPSDARPPDASSIELAQRILVRRAAYDDFPYVAQRVGEALWSGDKASLGRIAEAHGAADRAVAVAALASSHSRRERLGHYGGATLHYGGEGYQGVDRLVHLETRLAALGAVRGSRGRIVPRPAVELPADHARARRMTVEVFPSLLSPHTAIVMRRTVAWGHAAGVRLVLRPVPLARSTGVSPPWRQRVYLLRDAAREAALVGYPFGRIIDPSGPPLERAHALLYWAAQRGRAEGFLLSFLEGAYCHGIDVTRDVGLARVAERAGLPWHAARQQLEDDSWRDAVETNRRVFYDLGFDDVPGFRVSGADAQPDFLTAGQDRLWRVAREVQRRAALA